MTARSWSLGLVGLELALIGATASRVAARERNLATGLVFLAALGLGLWLAQQLVSGLARFGPEAKARLRLLAVSSTVGLLAAELGLRFGTDRFATYLEKTAGLDYQSPFEYDRSSWFHVHPANREIVSRRREFTHVRRTNSLGLPEREVPLEKAPDEYRILALGDSFTEGIGTSADRTWVKVLDRELAAAVPGRRVTTINAGVAGSDVPFEYVLLRDKLAAYRPDLVIVATNPTDAADVSVRGGRRRFRAGGSLGPGRPAPGWEWLYAISYLTRPVVLLRYDWLFIERARRPEVERDVVRELGDSFDDFAALARRQGFRLLVVAHPAVAEARLQKWSFGYDALITRLGDTKDLEVIDLLERLRERGAMDASNALEFYWPIDGHLNTKGHEMVGSAIADEVLDLGFLEKQLGVR